MQDCMQACIPRSASFTIKYDIRTPANKRYTEMKIVPVHCPIGQCGASDYAISCYHILVRPFSSAAVPGGWVISSWE